MREEKYICNSQEEKSFNETNCLCCQSNKKKCCNPAPRIVFSSVEVKIDEILRGDSSGCENSGSPRCPHNQPHHVGDDALGVPPWA